ncbi:MAG: fructosamine kinase family protein [Verrucomicrobiota bacterium]
MDASLKTAIEQRIQKATCREFSIQQTQSLSGGCIHQSFVVHDGQRSFFAKCNASSTEAIFRAEAQALNEIGATQTIRVPGVIAQGTNGPHAFLILEAIQFGSPSDTGWIRMGQQLALLHQTTATYFGWQQDNWIGSNPQLNPQEADWATFFCQWRLQPQLSIAKHNGYPFRHGQALLERATDLLRDHQPTPSLLHGDLWSGNAGFTAKGQPILYDPASYYGDRETDLAFTEFFGGFPDSFYRAYSDASPLPTGYEQRKALYNLYHLLNHANLFGGSYIPSTQASIDDLINR